LRLLPGWLVVPILQGPARGKKWIVGSTNHGAWLGSYEYEKQRTFATLVRPGDVIWDVGAHVGVYTLLASVLVGASGGVVAFEPFPDNLRFLYRHIAMNRLRNVAVVEAAVSDRRGEGFFAPGSSSSTGRLDQTNGTLRVRCITLDDALGEMTCPPPAVIKMDIEGGELQALRGGQKLLGEHHPAFFLSTHGGEIHRDCCNILMSFGYELRAIGTDAGVEDADEVLALHPARPALHPLPTPQTEQTERTIPT